jgi:hypothetical protein
MGERGSPDKVITQYDNVLKVAGDSPLLRTSAVPDLRFADEMEPGPLNHPGSAVETIGAEKDGCSKDTFERFHESSIFTASLHAECL